MANYFLILIPIVLITLGQTCAKFGAIKVAEGGSVLNIYILLGYTFLILRGLVWVVILKKMRLSFAYPFISISYVLILAISYYFFDEAVGVNKIIGTVLIMVGVFVTGLGRARDGGALNA